VCVCVCGNKGINTILSPLFEADGRDGDLQRVLETGSLVLQQGLCIYVVHHHDLYVTFTARDSLQSTQKREIINGLKMCHD